MMKLLRGGTDSWQIHLSAASSLVPTLISHLSPLPSLSQPPTWSSTSALEHFKLAPTGIAPDETPPNLDDIACDFLVGTFIWFDILSCASTNSSPHLPSSYTYLESHNIQLHKIMGCENMAMTLIAQISELSIWKTSQRNAGRLSIKELTSRGTEIERQLYNCLDDIDKRIGTLTSCGETSSYQNLGVTQLHTCLVKTRIFTFSALTYLHCTISGPNPSLAEIISSVTKSIEAFKELKESKMLRNLVWPFCVTGCMALKEQEEFFGGFMQWIGREEGNFGSLWKGWEVVKECWKLRGEGKEFDWVGAMGSLGFQVLLV
jgi:C6 transcription factor Pro1